jgi:hypothetical protein
MSRIFAHTQYCWRQYISHPPCQPVFPVSAFYILILKETSLYSYNKTNEMHEFLKFIFGIELYIIWAGFLSIIRSLILFWGYNNNK